MTAQSSKSNRALGVIIGAYKTEQEAQRNIEICVQEDLMLKTARSLVKKAVDGLIRMHHIDRPTAQDWIREAAD